MLLRHRDFERMSSWRPGLSGMHPTGESGFIQVNEWSSTLDNHPKFGSKVLPLSQFQLGVSVFIVHLVESIDPFELVLLLEVM